MDRNVKDFIGEGPYTLPVEQLDRIMNFYINKNMAVCIPKTTIFCPKTSHVHSSYEFSIPISLSPLLKVGKNNVILEKNKVFPCNTEQEHGPAVDFGDARFVAMQIDKKFVRETSRAVFGKDEIYFANDNYKFDKELIQVINRFIEESGKKQTGHEFIMDSLAVQIIVLLFRQIKTNMTGRDNKRCYSEKESIDRVIEYFMEYFNRDYSLNDVARIANLSPYHFIRVFKSHTGNTPYDYLLNIKMLKAKEMLASKRNSVTEVCFECGFNNLSHFTSVFKKKNGVNPDKL